MRNGHGTTDFDLQVKIAAAEARARARVLSLGGVFEDDEKTTDDRGRERCLRLAEEGDHWKALSELAGYDRWPSDAVKFMDDLATQPQVIGLGGHNTSKTFGMSALYECWFWQCLGWLPDASGQPQGCVIAIVGPGEKVVLGPAYRFGYLSHAKRVKAHTAKRPDLWGEGGLTIEGHGNASGASVNWVARPENWLFAAFYPKEKAGEDPDLLHQMSGVKHPTNLRVHLEEAAALSDMHFRTVRGWGARTVACVLNPVNPAGGVYMRSTNPDWRTTNLSQLRHENILLRDPSWVPGGPDHRELEMVLRDPAEVTVVGKLGEVEQLPGRGHFAYALPERDMEDKPGPRADGIPGHPDAEIFIFEPTREFSGQRLGEYLLTAGSGVVFPPVAWATCTEQVNVERRGVPDVVGVDCARISDRNTACPWYGPSARAALDELDRLKSAGHEHQAAALGAMRCYDCRGTGLQGRCPSCQGRGLYRPQLGRIRIINKDASPDRKALDLIDLFKVERRGNQILRPAFHIDPSGGGHEIAAELRARGVANVSVLDFSAKPPRPRHGTTPPYNLRAAMYQDLAYLVQYGMVEIVEQADLWAEAKEIREHEEEVASGARGRLLKMMIEDKKKLRKRLKRSPDYIDAAVLASAGSAYQSLVNFPDGLPGFEDWA